MIPGWLAGIQKLFNVSDNGDANRHLLAAAVNYSSFFCITLLH